MISLRILTTRPVIASLAVLLLGACDPSTEHPSAPFEKRLAETTRALERSQAALAAAEHRIAALQGELELRTQTLGRQLANASERLRRNENLLRTHQSQGNASADRVHRLLRERAALRADLTGAGEEIRRLRARQDPDHRRLAELNERGAAAEHAVGELRRYNAYLLQERSNLQAWLEEANRVREEQQIARSRSQHALARLRSQKDAAEAAGDALRRKLDEARARVSTLEHSRDALVEEVSMLRTAASEMASPGGSDDALPAQPAKVIATTNERTASGAASGDDSAANDTAALHAELAQARQQIAGLRSAKDYLVEKIEACMSARSSADTDAAIAPAQLALIIEWMSRRGALHESRAHAVNAAWGAPSADAIARRAATTPVAEANEPPTEGTRRRKEIEAAKQKLSTLGRKYEALEARFEALEKECATVREQAQTLTWANEVLVKELDTAYATGGAGKLPEGTRGIYLLRDGESLSRVAKAFYGDARRWQDIVEANKTKIPDPDKVEAGTVILIPE